MIDRNYEADHYGPARNLQSREPSRLTRAATHVANVIGRLGNVLIGLEDDLVQSESDLRHQHENRS